MVTDPPGFVSLYAPLPVPVQLLKAYPELALADNVTVWPAL